MYIAYLNRSLCNYQTDSRWDSLEIFAFNCIFIDAINSRVEVIYFELFKYADARIWTHMELSPLYCKENAITNCATHPFQIYVSNDTFCHSHWFCRLPTHIHRHDPFQPIGGILPFYFEFKVLLLLFNPSSLYLFCAIASAHRGWGVHLWYLKLQTWCEVETCSSILYVKWLGYVIVAWFMDLKLIFADISTSRKWRHQPTFFVKETYFRKLQGHSMSLT